MIEVQNVHYETASSELLRLYDEDIKDIKQRVLDIVYSSIALPLAERLCVQQGPQMTPTGGGYCRGEDRTARDRGLTLTLTHTPQRPFVAICAFVPRFPPDPVHPERTIPNFIPSYSRRAVRGKSTCLQSARPIPPFSKRAWRSSRASQRAPRKGARAQDTPEPPRTGERPHAPATAPAGHCERPTTIR